MACSFVKNEKGKIVGVLSPEGKPSKLFKQIISTPLLSLEESIEAYKNIFSNKVTVKEDAKLVYKTPNGETYTSYSEALQNTPQGEIKGVVDGVELFSVNATTNINTFYGQINDLIKEGMLTGEKYLDKDGQEKYRTEGNSKVKKAINGEIVKRETRKTFGTRNVKQTQNGDFIFKNAKNQIAEKYDKQEVMSSDPATLARKENGISLLAYQAHNKATPTFSEVQATEEIEFVPENQLQLNLMNLLNDLGIKTMSISNYVTNYKTKNGVEPSAQALADITNKIIAFKDGKITPEELTEEVSHFIVEAWNQDEIENILRNIHKTAEWKQYSENYRRVYSKEYSEEELEQAVRREVLGKILASSLQNRFQQQTETQTEQSIINKIFELFSNFMDRVSAFFKSEYQTQLDKFNKQIYQNLMQGELQEYLNENNFKDNRFRLYSTSNPIENNAEKLRRTAERAVTMLSALNYRLNNKDISAKQKAEIVKHNIEGIVFKDEDGNITINQAEKVATVSGLASIAQNQVKYLRRAVRKNKGKSFYFSSEELSVYNSLVMDFSRMLNEMSNLVKGETELENIIKETNDLISELDGEVGVNKQSSLDRLVTEYANKAALTSDQEAEFRKALEGIQTDTNMVFAHLGQLVNAKSGYLALAADISSRVTTEHRINFQANVKKFLKEMQTNGFDLTKLKQFKKGNYMEHRTNMQKVETATMDKRYSLFIEQVGKLSEEKYQKASQLTREEFEKAFVERTLPELLSFNQRHFNRELRKWQLNEFMESRFTKEEAEKRENKYQGYSEDTRDFEENQSMDYGFIMSQADKVDGRTVITEDIKSDIEDLKKRRVEKKSIFASDGSYKKGLYPIEQESEDSVKVGNLNVVINRDVADSDSIIAFELNQIDAKTLEEFKKGDKVVGGISEVFKQYIDTLDNDEALDFLFLNSYIGFSQEYYDSFENKPSLIEKLQEVDDEDIQDLIKRINETSVSINNILRANRTLNRPSEINYERMSKQVGGEADSIKRLQEKMQSLYKEAYVYLGKEEERTQETESLSETSTNEAFDNWVADNGLKTTNLDAYLSKLYEHMTKSDVDKVAKVRDDMRRNIENVAEKHSRIFSGSTDINQIEEEFINYAHSKLLPYFKKSTPKGFNDVIGQLYNGDITVKEFLDNYQNGQYEYLTVNPNFSFQEANDETKKNKIFENNLLNGIPQYRIFDDNGEYNQYVDKEYIDKYGIQFDENGVETATKNIKEYEARGILLDFHKESLKALGKFGEHNIYKLPQKEKGRFRKIQDATKKGGIKNFIEEFTNYREDDVDFGQTLAGEKATSRFLSSDVIPMYGLTDLKEKDNVTDELLYSYTWMAEQAYLYKARVENIGDMLALRDTLLGADFGDKRAEASQAFKMFESNLKYNFFGVKESIGKAGEFEVLGIKGSGGALANSFVNFVRLVNLGFNVIVPITSALTGGVQLTIERLIGERLDKDSRVLADKEFGRLAAQAMSEMGTFKSEARLNVLGEWFGVYGMNERFENSNMGKFGRAIQKSAYMAHSMGNFPIIPRVMLSVLYDHKIVDGQMFNYRQFKLRQTELNDKQARELWKNYTSVYEALDTIDGVASFNKEKIAELRGTNENEEQFIKDMHNTLSNRINQASSEIDGSISPDQKSIMARNAYFNAFGLHRNWMVIATQKRLKSRQMNAYSGFYEEGVWRTLPRMANVVLTDWIKHKKPFLESFKKQWEEAQADPTAMKNLKRMAIEMAVINGLLGLAAILAKGIEDPEEDSYLEVMTEYLALRTSTEMISSASPRGLPSEWYSVLENMFVGLDKANIILDIDDSWNSEVITRGKFAGFSAQERYLYRNYPIFKEYFSMTNLDKTRDTYNYFNVVKGEKLKYTLYDYLHPKE